LFNPEFMSKHPVAEQLGILVHELLHAALRHVERRASANPHLWNIAADIVVNGMILKTQGLALPKSAVHEPDLEQFPVEEVYEILLKRHGLPRKILFIGSDLMGPAEAQGEGLGEHWNSALSQAAVVARMGGMGRGSLPAGIERAISVVTNPPLDWRTMLWRHLTKTPVDFTSFDRRFFGEGIYLDSMDGETVHVAVCVDTSGSIGEEELGRFLNEIRAILGAYPSITVDLHTCDTNLLGPWKIDSPDCPVPTLRGGRRHQLRSVFRGLESNRSRT
jgi:predicted metal-dependent peptidase